MGPREVSRGLFNFPKREECEKMKRLMLGTAVATGLVVAMAGNGMATELMTCDMEQAIAEAWDVILAVDSTLSDAKGVSLQQHIEYLSKRVQWAQEAVDAGYATDPEELYATITEGTRALKLISGLAKEEARQTAAPKTTAQPTTQTVAAKTVDQVQNNIQTEKVEKTEKATEMPKVVRATQTATAKLAVAKIETAVPTNGAKLASLNVSTKVAGPEETAGLEQEINVPATGEIDTGELERILMTAGMATLAGVLGLAGICAVIGRR